MSLITPVTKQAAAEAVGVHVNTINADVHSGRLSVDVRANVCLDAVKKRYGSGARKVDGLDKVDLTLVPGEAINAIAQAFEFGARKHGRDNYKKKPYLDQHVLKSAALGHILADLAGEELDEESGLPHLYLAGAQICIALHNSCREKIRQRFKRGES